MTTLLALDTSFDDTAAAVLFGPTTVGSNVVAAQHKAHDPFGGVVPEVASRLHVEQLLPTVDRALSQAGIGMADIEAIAVTDRPGLQGSLLVGLDAAKSFSLALKVPLIAVHHIEAHLYALFIDRPELKPPVVCLVASGGHTSLLYLKAHGAIEVLGRTGDDAAGEAFDKVARAAGLPLPGGPALSELAKQGDPKAVDMPRPFLGELDFSFSGLKTHAARLLAEGKPKADVAAAFEDSVVHVLLRRLVKCAHFKGVAQVALGGGVAANSALRCGAEELAKSEGLELVIPHKSLCTDNAAMVGCLGHFMLDAGLRSPLDTDARSAAQVGERPWHGG